MSLENPGLRSSEGGARSHDPFAHLRPAAEPAGAPAGTAGTGLTVERDEHPRSKRAKRAKRRDGSTPAAHEQLSKRAKRRKVRARRVHRIVRHVDPWSVLKVSLLFYFTLFCIVLVAGLILWQAARATDVLNDFEGFVRDLGDYETWKLDGRQILQASVLGGLVLVIAGSAANVLLAVLFNLISDLTGGVRVTVLEEEPRRTQPPAETTSQRPAQLPKTGSPPQG